MANIEGQLAIDFDALDALDALDGESKREQPVRAEARPASDYDRICTFDSLYKAHCTARLCKRKKREVIEFEMDLARNLVDISDQLTARTYHMNGYYHFMVMEPKEREIFAAHYRDRVVLHSVCDEVLVPLFEKLLIYDNAACRKGKGTHFALRRFKGFLREHYKAHGNRGYVLKCDISKYFASIDHEILLGKLRRVIRDDDVFNLIEDYVRNYHTKGMPGVGLPLGNQTSQLFALYYLDGMDRMLKERMRFKHYVRYMDDFLVLHHDKGRLEEAREAVQRYVESELKLTLNAKTRIIPLSQGVEFLGWRFYLTREGRIRMRLRKQSKNRFARRMKRLAEDYMAGKATEENVRATIASYKGHLKHGDAHFVQERVMGKFWSRVGDEWAARNA